MILGAHVIVNSKDAEADRAFFREVLGLSSVDAGHGWLIFPLAAQLAAHPAPENDRHEIFLICDDIDAQVQALVGKGVPCSEVHEESWGFVTKIKLPGGGVISLYQPKHRTAIGL